MLVTYVGGAFAITYDLSWGFLLGAALIVLVSWMDDLYSVPFIWRLATHSLAAAALLYDNGFISVFAIGEGGRVIDIGWVGAVLTFCWVVWLINAYNFMDGIDGIAGIEALAAGLGWTALGINWNLPVVFVLGGTLTFVSFAFLLHNWPPARIFMGDAGSAFLGFVFAAVPLLSKPESNISKGDLLIAGVLFVWLFVFDSVFTFIRRAGRFEKVWQAHREHLYQRLVRSSYSHKKTTLVYGLSSLVVSAATVIWLADRSLRAYVMIVVIVLAQSLLILALCLKRKCLFGDIS